jgi:hypothetical protein
MSDHISSPYDYQPHPRAVTGEPESWPWNVGAARAEAAPAAPVAPAAPAVAPPTVLAPGVYRCAAYGCESVAAGVRKNTHPALRPFCERHRVVAVVRVAQGRTHENAAERLRVGLSARHTDRVASAGKPRAI